VVIPDGHYKNHTSLECVTHSLKTATRFERVGVTESSLLSIAEVVRDRVECLHSRDVRVRVLDDLAVLDVQATDLDEVTVGRVVGRQELSDNSDLLSGVDSQAGPEERLITHAPRVEVATVCVTETVVAVGTSATVCARAASLTVDSAVVRGNSGSLIR
jgi:hypothetical protein